MAAIVAERTPSSMRAISPKWSPGPRLARPAPRTVTLASPDSIRKNAAPSAPSFTTISPAVKWRSLKRSATCASWSSSRSANSGTRRNSPTGAPAISLLPLPSSAAHLRHCPALQQVDGATGDGPFDVAVGAVHGLGAARELVQLVESRVVEAESLDELRGDVVLDRAAVRDAADGDPFQPGPPLAHLPVPGDAIAVRDHEDGHDGL